MRIAMWSGPRNLSTAMMYAFANRSDCAVVDEPFYAAYLAKTGLDHPMKSEVVAAGETDPVRVSEQLLRTIPDGKSVYYQKHMTQHMVATMPTDWISEVSNVFLLRHPARVVASFAVKYPNFDKSDLGFEEQVRLFDLVRALGQEPIVIDSYDIRQNPEKQLRKLCAALGLEFQSTMLQWPSGGHPADGVWATHWYDAVHKSTGFAGPEGQLPTLPGNLKTMVADLMPHYERLYAERL